MVIKSSYKIERIKRRGFEPVRKEKLIEPVQIYIPQRATKFSCGYDFRSPLSFTIAPGSSKKIYTNIKAYMLEDEYLSLHIRSSIALKKNLIFKNQTGIIDSDYYNNESNDGNIICCLMNIGKNEISIEQGEKIFQGIFSLYFITDNDEPLSRKRVGGVGSTGV